MIGPGLVGRGRSAGLVTRLAHDHSGAGAGEVGGGDQTVVAAADHDRVVDVRTRQRSSLDPERRFNSARYPEATEGREAPDLQGSSAVAWPEVMGVSPRSGSSTIAESPAATPAIAYIPRAPTTGSTNAAATNDTVSPPWNKPSTAPSTRLRTESGDRRWNRFCSATPVTPSLAPQATFRIRTSANHGESAIAKPRHAVNAVPRTSQRASVAVVSQRPAREPRIEPAPHRPIISPNPADPASNTSTRGTSPTIAIPMPRTRTTQATAIRRSTGSWNKNRNP